MKALKFLLLISVLSGCTSDKGKLVDKEMTLIINDRKYKLWAIYDGSVYPLKILIPECKNCEVPFSVNQNYSSGKSTATSNTIIVPSSLRNDAESGSNNQNCLTNQNNK